MNGQAMGFRVVGLMCLGIFVCMIDSTIMNITLPVIQEKLHVSLEMMSWMLNVYTMSIAVLSIPLARMAEIYGKGRFFLLGLLLFGGGSAWCGFSTCGEMLIAARFLQSVGAAVLMPLAMILGVGAVPVAKRHLAFGLLGGTQGLAAALGPTIGGIITQELGWPWVFYVNVPICLVAALLTMWMLNLRQEARVRVKIDWIGMVLSSIAIFALTLGLVKGNDWGWGSDRVWGCLGSSAAAFVLFLLAERRVASPMVDLRLFRVTKFSAATLVTLISNVLLIGVTVLLPQFLTHLQGKTELQAALLVTPISGTIFILAPISGMVARKLGNVWPILIGFIAMGGAYALLRSLAVDTTSGQLIAACVLLGAGFGLVVGPVSLASAAEFEGEQLTASQSVTQLFRQVGIVLAVAVFIAGLTHEVTVQKESLLRYAEQHAATMNVPNDVKSQVLATAKEKINSSTGVDAKQQADAETATATPAKREQLIQAQVDRILAERKGPEPSDAVRAQFAAQVAPRVDAQLAAIEAETKAYATDLQKQSEQKMTAAFANLYGVAFPVACVCGLFAFFFRSKRLGKRVEKKTADLV